MVVRTFLRQFPDAPRHRFVGRDHHLHALRAIAKRWYGAVRQPTNRCRCVSFGGHQTRVD
jgi:hypothetical protein